MSRRNCRRLNPTTVKISRDAGLKARSTRTGEVPMPNPKRRHSQARTSKRRSHDHLTAQSLSECPNCHERKLPHRACPKCGYYKGREIIEVEESTS